MTFDVINDKVFGFSETIKNGHRTHVIVSFAEIVDYELLNERLLKTVTIKQIIELDKYLKKEKYLFVERKFERIFPDGIVMFIDNMRQREGKSPISY